MLLFDVDCVLVAVGVVGVVCVGDVVAVVGVEGNDTLSILL